MTVPRRSVGLAAFLVCFITMLSVARADQQYRVDGHDTFVIGSADLRSDVGYHGTQTLTMRRDGKNRRYIANVEYQRNDQGSAGHARGSFESTITADGEQRDGPNNDPDYLTVLNQPFAVQLDRLTLRDLAHLHGSVPFDFPSPMTGAPLHGILRRVPDAVINGERVLGVAFEASGPLHGTLPDHPEMALAGRITMKGTAYYTYAAALMLALDATLAINGNVDDTSRRDPVAITYTRSIHATTPNSMNNVDIVTKPTRAR
jgi:hypothetical protein